jgi:MEMO1 family protein
VRSIRHPAVAGTFYPADPEALRAQVRACLAEGRRRQAARIGGLRPKALVVPHAGYVYSGPVAGSAFALLAPWAAEIRSVVLFGPSHRVAFGGLATSTAAAWATPLGEVALDPDGKAALEALPQVKPLDAAHAREHSLEVELPFLQESLSDFTLLPVVAGHAPPPAVAEALGAAWGGDETLVVVSSDLSHYLDYGAARALDRATSAAIEALRPEDLGHECACGGVPLRGLLVAARTHGLTPHTLDLRSSGDTAGPRDQVVGYGAYAFV